ncbi:MAG: CxxC motif-containing protein (DUF1111 family) [Myxococcota bacterium]|jgi:CxxC motif-containing protein (DUF1111 family)
MRAAILSVAVLGLASVTVASTALDPLDAVTRVGRDLFVREWVANDPRSAAGSGLGEQANAESCVACHSLGGVGGAGGRSRNVGTAMDIENLFGGMQNTMVPPPMFVEESPFPNGPGRVVLADIGSARNPPALFGAGLIDRVPESALRTLAAKTYVEHPAISGRVSEAGDGRVGRFAWKGHVSSLADFVAQACEVELGLVVERPGEETSVVAADLLAPQTDALARYVGALAAPQEQVDQPLARRGERVFEQVGCVSCHVESVGPAKRVFSDLLLHDMGPVLSDAGFGYAQVAPSELVAMAQEWRTPPLWGIRDSGPYLHDGRADTLTDAISLHGGEAETVIAAFTAVSEEDRRALDSFLRSLVAPL